MTDGAGGDLHDRRARFAQPLRVVVRGQVADNHARLQDRAQLPNALANKGRLARAGRGQEVQDQQAAGAEEAPVALRETVVLVENGPAHLDGAACPAADLGCVLVVRFIVRMGVGVRVSVRVRVFLTMVMPGAHVRAHAHASCSWTCVRGDGRSCPPGLLPAIRIRNLYTSVNLQ